MTRGVANSIHVTIATLTATGALLIWMVLIADPPSFEDIESFAVEQSGQAITTELHILAGPILIFLVGLIWGSHVWSRIRNGATSRRRTGIALTVCFPLLALSGYLLQIASDEAAREALGWSHAVCGVVFAGIYLVHLSLRPPQPITIEAFAQQAKDTSSEPKGVSGAPSRHRRRAGQPGKTAESLTPAR